MKGSIYPVVAHSTEMRHAVRARQALCSRHKAPHILPMGSNLITLSVNPWIRPRFFLCLKASLTVSEGSNLLPPSEHELWVLKLSVSGTQAPHTAANRPPRTSHYMLSQRLKTLTSDAAALYKSVCARPGPGAKILGPLTSDRRMFSADQLLALRPLGNINCIRFSMDNIAEDICPCCSFSTTTSLSRFYFSKGNITNNLDSLTHVTRPFSFLSLNCRWLPKHKMDIFDLLIDEQPDALFLTETWLHESSGPDVAVALPPNFAIVRKDRLNKIGGGIAIIFKTHFLCKFESLDFLNCEAAHFKLTLNPNFTFSGLLIYRPPGPATSWATIFPSLITPFLMSSKNFSVIGDLNLHLDDPLDSTCCNLIADLAAMNINLFNLGPTHIAGHLLDPIFSSLPHIHCDPAVPIFGQIILLLNLALLFPLY